MIFTSHISVPGTARDHLLSISGLIVLLRYAIGSDTFLNFQRYLMRSSSILKRVLLDLQQKSDPPTKNNSAQGHEDISAPFLPIVNTLNLMKRTMVSQSWNIVPDVSFHRLVLSIMRKAGAYQLAIDYFKSFCFTESDKNSNSAYYDASINAMLLDLLSKGKHYAQIEQVFSFLRENQKSVEQLELNQISKLSRVNNNQRSKEPSLFYDPIMASLSSVVHALSMSGNQELYKKAWGYFERFYLAGLKDGNIAKQEPTPFHPLYSEHKALKAQKRYAEYYKKLFSITMAVDLLNGLCNLPKIDRNIMLSLNPLFFWIKSTFADYEYGPLNNVDFDLLETKLASSGCSEWLQHIKEIKDLAAQNNAYRLKYYFQWKNPRSYIRPGVVSTH
jgi:hypothetical protein